MIEIPEGMEEIVISVKKRFGLAYCMAIEFEHEEEINPSALFYDIWNLLKNSQYPDQTDKKTRITLRKLASRYIICAGRLYKMNFNGTHLQCLLTEESSKMMDEVHGGDCGSHMSGHTLVHKIIRQGYYWSTLQSDCNDHVRRCHKCQIYANSQKLPPRELYNKTTSWPFATWGIDIIGKVSSK